MTKHKLLSEIFRIVKDEVEIPYHVLYKAIDAPDYQIDRARNRLIKDYGLIEVIQQRLSLTREGEKYQTFDLYINSLKPKSDKVKIASLILTALFGLIAIYQKYDYQNVKTNLEILEEKNDSLMAEINAYRDSLFVMTRERKK